MKCTIQSGLLLCREVTMEEDDELDLDDEEEYEKEDE
jgi:hypothetical protein